MDGCVTRALLFLLACICERWEGLRMGGVVL